MPVFHLNDLPKNKRIQMIGEFYDVIDSLKDRAEVRFFFKSLLTADEIATLMRRIEIAVLLSVEYNYKEIKKVLGVGNNKITSVHKALQQDDNGYNLIIKKLIGNRKKRLRDIKIMNKRATGSSPLVAYKRKHPGFLLENLLDTAIKRMEIDEKELEEEALLFTPSAGNKKFK